MFHAERAQASGIAAPVTPSLTPPKCLKTQAIRPSSTGPCCHRRLPLIRALSTLFENTWSRLLGFAAYRWAASLATTSGMPWSSNFARRESWTSVAASSRNLPSRSAASSPNDPTILDKFPSTSSVAPIARRSIRLVCAIASGLTRKPSARLRFSSVFAVLRPAWPRDRTISAPAEPSRNAPDATASAPIVLAHHFPRGVAMVSLPGMRRRGWTAFVHSFSQTTAGTRFRLPNTTSPANSKAGLTYRSVICSTSHGSRRRPSCIVAWIIALSASACRASPSLSIDHV